MEKLSKDYLKLKRDEARSKLSTLAEWIKRFQFDAYEWNKCFDEDLGASVADIRVSDNISLLHAAIYIRDSDLVEKLLQLGANPIAESKVGSALSLARMKRQRGANQFSAANHCTE